MNRLIRTDSFARRFWPLFLLGLPGVASLLFSFPHALSGSELPPELNNFSSTQLALLSLLQPTLLLAIGAALGAKLARPLGFHSDLVDTLTGSRIHRRNIYANLYAAIVTGTAIALLTWLIEMAVFKPLLPDFFEKAAIQQPRDFALTLSGLLYGGITEEVISRWGIMSLLAWLGWKLFQPNRLKAGPAVIGGALLLSALLFGMLHLPAAAAIAPLNELLIVRIMMLNTLAALAFGWLYWRRSLEAAMIAHAVTHLVMSLATFLA